MSCSKETLFSHVIFRPESEIVVFINKLFQILQQRSIHARTKIAEFGLNSFNELRRQPKIESIQSTGWLNARSYPEVYRSIGPFIQLLNGAAEQARQANRARAAVANPADNQIYVYPKYNDRKFMDLIRAIRNCNAHEYLDTSSHNLPCSQALTNARDSVASVLRNKPIYFWLQNFPDLIFLLYSAGFQTQIEHWNSCPDLTDYLSRFYINNNELRREVPCTVVDFVTQFASAVSLDSEYITDRLLQSVYYHGIEIRVVKNPNTHSRLRYNDQSGEMLFISFEIISEEIRRIRFQRKSRMGSPIGETLDMIVEPSVPYLNTLPSLIVFSKDIKASIQHIISDTEFRNRQRLLIYTTKDYASVKNTFEDPFFNLNEQLRLQKLCWSKLCPNYKINLFSKELKLYANSTMDVKLESFFPQHQPPIVSHETDRTLILSLIHDNTLIKSNIPAMPVIYESRWLRKINDIDEDTFKNECISFNCRIIVIKGILGMGKSSLLFSLGDKFIKDGVIVSYCTAKQFISTNTNQVNPQNQQGLHNFFPNTSPFELEVINAFLNSNRNSTLNRIRKCIVLFDGLEEVSNADINTCLSYINTISNFNCKLQFIIACQPAQVREINKRLSHTLTYNIIGFDRDQQLEYFRKVWGKYILNDPLKNTKVEEILDFLIAYDKYFPDLAETPLTCVLRSTIYDKLARDLQRPKKEDLVGLEETLDQYMELRLRNHLHKYYYPKNFNISFTNDSRWFLQIPKAVLKSICEQHAATIIFKDKTIDFPRFYPSELENLADVNELGLLDKNNSFVDKNMSDFFAASLIARGIKCADRNFYGILDLFVTLALELSNPDLVYSTANLPNQASTYTFESGTAIVKAVNVLLDKYNDTVHKVIGQIFTTYHVTEHEMSLTLRYLLNNSNYTILDMFVTTIEKLKKTAAVIRLCRKLVDNSPPMTQKDHQNAFSDFVKSGNLLVTKFLLHGFKFDVNLSAEKGETPLHIAVKIPEANTKLQMVSLLMENCANVLARDKNDKTPFEIACNFPSKDTLVLLLKRYYDFTLKSKLERKFKESVISQNGFSESEKEEIKCLIIKHKKIAIIKPGLYQDPIFYPCKLL